MTERAYSYPAWRMRLGQAAMLVIVGCGVAAVVVGSGPVWAYPPIIAFLLGSAWWTVVVAPRRLVTETAEGIRTWNFAYPGKVVVAWDQIDRFEPIGSPLGTLVEAIDHRGKTTLIVGLDAGSSTSWSGEEPGETDDIVAELNRRLVLWREELGLPQPRAAGAARP